MLISATPSLGNKAICRYPGYNKMILILSPFLNGIPISIVQGCRSYSQLHIHNFWSQTLPPRDDFELFLILPEAYQYKRPKSSFHTPGLGAQFIYKLLLSHLGGRKKELAGTISFSANIADVRIPFQIICNCNTEVFDVINIFENCIL